MVQDHDYNFRQSIIEFIPDENNKRPIPNNCQGFPEIPLKPDGCFDGIATADERCDNGPDSLCVDCLSIKRGWDCPLQS